MRFRTLALALALCFGSTALVQAAPAKQKTFKLRKVKASKGKVKPAKGAKGVQSKAAKVKPRKAKKTKIVHQG
jgi:hypothetical protein